MVESNEPQARHAGAMPHDPSEGVYDYSAPEVQAALGEFTRMIDDVRNEYTAELIRLEAAIERQSAELADRAIALDERSRQQDQYRQELADYAEELQARGADLDRYSAQIEGRIGIYERTLGLAVIPLLVRRAIGRLRNSGGRTR